MMGSPQGRLQMSVSLYSARNSAVALAGAFLTAMLFVSAAVGPLQIV